ncbi:general substrate transporter [Aspergillus granulosus]|uniref:General substrate transporter n=1 Tax=Aspergillus granulosus TaxID=176169 RepID=A0ABR4HPX4_9EURO
MDVSSTTFAMHLTGSTLRRTIFANCCFAFVLFGYDQGVLAGLASTPQFHESFNHPSSDLLGTIVAIYDIGCFVGALSMLFIGDWLGRRRSIVLGGILICVGALLQASSYTVAHMIVGRIVTGIGNGINTATVPVYQAEMSSSSRRGAAVMAELAFTIFGIPLSNWVDFAFVYGGTVHGSAQWRIPLALQAIFPVGTFLLIPLIPESPRWLAFRGRNEEVHQVVAQLEGNNASADSPHVCEKAKLIIDSARHEAELKGSWLDLFRNDKLQNLRRIILGAVPQFLQQFTGINAVVYFGPSIFATSLGFSPRLSAIVSGCGSIVFFIGSCLPVLFIEKSGRRPIMIWGLITTCISMAALVIAAYHAQIPSLQRASGYGAIACIFTYQFVYGASWAGIPWVYAPEINSLRMRIPGQAIASATEWISNYIVVQITPTGLESLGWRFFLIWVVIMAAAVPYLYFCVPETGGAALEEVDTYFMHQKGWVVMEAQNVREFVRERVDVERVDKVDYQETNCEKDE